MVIDNQTYKLKESNYFKDTDKKSLIVLGNSYTKDMSHVLGWENRKLGNFKKTATYSIDTLGNIYQHYPNYFSSNFINDYKIDIKLISILLVNEGYLKIKTSPTLPSISPQRWSVITHEQSAAITWLHPR